MTKRKQRYVLLSAMIPAAMLVAQPVWGDNYNYLGNTTSGTWNNAALWTGGSGSFPTLAGDVANVTRDFTSSSQGLTVNVPITLGILNIGDTGGSVIEPVIIGNNNVTTNVVTFDNSGSAAQINQISTAGGDTIAVPILMMGDLQISNASASSLSFLASVASPINGTGSFASAATSGTQTISFGGTGTGGGPISAPISNGSTGGTVAVAVNGGGNWVFSSTSSTYTGATTINTGGTLSVTGSLSSTAINVNGGTFGEFFNPSTGSLGGTCSLAVSSGTANLQGSNTYSGATTVSGGTLNLSGSLSGTAITVSSGTLTQTSFLGGSLTGATSLTVTGGVAALLGTGTDNYSGATTLNGGQLQYNAASRLSINSNIVLNGGIISSAANSLTFNATIGTGPGQVQWTGSGGFSTVSGSNALNIQLNNGTGTIVWGSPGFVPDGSSLLFGSSTQGAAPNFQNGIDLGSAARTVSVSPSTGSGEISGVIQGSGSLVKDGPGALFLPTQTNTYTGGTTVKAGTLQVAADSDLGPVPGSAAVNITLDGGAIQGNLTISTTRTIQLNSGGGTFNTQQIPAIGSGGGTIIFGGVVQGAGGLTAIGGGTLRLTGINTYTGGTTITGLSNTLRTTVVTRATNATLGASTNGLVMTNAILDTFGQPLTVGALSGDANSIITNSNQNANNTFTVNNTDSSTFAGIIGNENANGIRPIALTKSGTGSLLLSGANNYTGAVTVSGGTLQLGNATALGFGGLLGKINSGLGVVQSTTVSAGTLDLNAQTVEEPIVLSGGSLINSNTSTAAKVDNGLAGIQFTNGGTLYNGTISVAISGTGGATATATQSGAAINSITTTASGTGYTSVPTVSITGSGGGSGAVATAVLSSVSLTPATNSSIGGAGNLAIPAVISGGGSLTKTGAGTLTLSGSNTYTGTTTVSNGTLLAANTAGSATGTNTVAVNGAGSLGGGGAISGAVTVSSGGTIFAGTSAINTPGNVASVLTIGSGSSLLGSTLLDLTAANASDEIIAGSVATGTVTFGGALTVTNPNTISFAAGQSYDLFGFHTDTGGSTFSMVTLPNLTAGLAWDSSQLYTNGIISIVSGGPTNGTWVNLGSDTNWETAANWARGAIPGVAGSVATFSDPSVSVPATANLSANETVGGLVFNGHGAPVNITASAGKSLTLDNSNSGAAINVTGSASIAAPLVLNDNATVTTAVSSSLSISGNISGTKKLTTAGNGSVTLSGSNSFGGGTEVSGGTLNIQSTTALPATSNLTVDDGATVVANRNGGGRITLDLASLSNSGLIDLQNNTMVLHNASPTVAATVQSELQSGFNGGGWNGASGIISSTAQNSFLNTLGEVLNGTNLTVAYAYYGDADLSGVVDGSDYSAIDAHNGTATGGTWQTGDFNYDGSVDGSDYTLIDNAFNLQNGNAVNASEIAANTSEIAGGSVAVPEPGSVSLLAISAASLLTRRRRK